VQRIIGQEVMLILAEHNLFSFRTCFKQNKLYLSATGMFIESTVPKSLARGWS